MKIIECEQGSDAWLQARKGHPSASNFDKIVTAAKCELSKQAEGYINDLIAETFVPDWNPMPRKTYWMERGTEMEPQARLAFQVKTGAVLKQVGFLLHDGGILGCSPDSLVMDGDTPVEGVEIKCPGPNTHVEYVRSGVLPDSYKLQVHGSLVVSGLPRWHFFSFYPGLQPFHIVVERDEFTDKVETALLKFSQSYQAAYKAALPLLQLPSNAE